MQNGFRLADRRMTMNEIEARGKIKYRIANEMRKYGENKEEYEDLEIALQVMKEIREYRELGTVEELQALKEKNTPYKPQEYEDRYYACKCDNILLPKWRKYPTDLMPKSEGLPHCMACGQKLDWE